MADRPISDVRLDFYVYVHRRATDGKVFYIGKGCGGRAFKPRNRNPHWHCVAKKHGFQAEIVRGGLSEADALKLEVELISSFGLGNLCNFTIGGSGTAGFRHSAEAKAAIGAGHRGKTRSPEARARMSAAQTGRHVSDEVRAAIRAKLKGRPLDAETCRKMSAARTGLHHTEGARKKMRQGWTEQRRAAMGEAGRRAHSKPVECVETGVMFASLRDAAAWAQGEPGKGGHAKISECCRGKRKSAYGHHWRYAA